MSFALNKILFFQSQINFQVSSSSSSSRVPLAALREKIKYILQLFESLLKHVPKREKVSQVLSMVELLLGQNKFKMISYLSRNLIISNSPS